MAAGCEKLDKYGDFATIDALANGDITRYKEVEKMTISTVLVKLKYDSDKAEYQDRYAEQSKK